MKNIAKKLVALIITLFIVSFLAFLAFQIIPGDPTTKMLGTEATPEAVSELRSELGLDLPFFVRYWHWLTAFVQGDFGMSYSYHMPVRAMLADKLPVTALLILLAFGFTVILSLPLGILAGRVRNRWADTMITAVDQVVMSVPAFFVGILACFIFGLTFHLFVPGNFISYTDSWAGCLGYLVFPALSIAIPRIAMTVKMLRGAIGAELRQDYVRTSQSRGASRGYALRRHVLRNALIPTIAFLAVSAAEIMTGTIVIEQVFTIPGIGRLLLASIGNRDFPVVQAIVVLMAAWIVLVHFLADLLSSWVDPRIRTH